MKKTMSLTGLAALVAVTAFAPTAQAAITLPDPGDVGPYRIAFVTSVNPSGASDMTSLNAWVTGLATAASAVDAGGALGTTWSVIGATTAVGATPAVSVFDNTDTEPGVDASVPIYLVNGNLFAADYATFWSNNINLYDANTGGTPPGTNKDAILNVTELGGLQGGHAVHTGLYFTGTGPAGFTVITYDGKELNSGGAVGQGGMNWGYTLSGNNGWFGNGESWQGSLGAAPLWAISGVIAVPEPASMSLLGLGGLGLLLRRRRS